MGLLQPYGGHGPRDRRADLTAGAIIVHSLDHALAAAGADIIDVVGESSRPGAAAIPVDVELARVVPVVAAGLVVIHYHYFTDTVVGAAVGIAVALATALCVDLVRDRLLADRPREPVTSPAPDLAAVSSQNQDGTA